MRENKSLNDLLLRLYSAGEMPRKQAHIILSQYSSATVYRAVDKAINQGYAEVIQVNRVDGRNITHIRITKPGQDYLKQKGLLSPELKEQRKRLSVKGEKKRRIQRISKTEDMCRGAGIALNIPFDCLSEERPPKELRQTFVQAFTKSAIFFTSNDVKQSKKEATEAKREMDEMAAISQGRCTGVILNQNGFWMVYHSLNALMRCKMLYEKTIEDYLRETLQNSWFAKTYPERFPFAQSNPQILIIGDTPSMLPKIYTTRKWGETENDNIHKQGIAENMLGYKNLREISWNVEFIPNSKDGIECLKHIINTPSDTEEKLNQHFSAMDLSCTKNPVNHLYYVYGLDTDKDVIALPTFDLMAIDKIRMMQDTVFIVTYRSMGDAVCRVLGEKVENIYDFDFNQINAHFYTDKGWRRDGKNPLTKNGYDEIA